MVQARDLRVKDRADGNRVEVGALDEAFAVSVVVPPHWLRSGRCFDVLLMRFLAAYDAARGERYDDERGIAARVRGRCGVSCSTPLSRIVAAGGSTRIDVVRSPPLPPPARPPPPVLRPRGVVATFVSEKYVPLLHLWLRCLERSGATGVEVAIFALDERARCAASASLALRPSLRGRVLHRPCRVDDRRDLWAWRLAVLGDAVDDAMERRIDFVVHSDVDAFWVGDAMAAAAARLGPTDLAAFSVDRGGGRAARAKQFALCPGWFLLRAGEAARAFLGEWRQVTSLGGDDQNALNVLYDDRLAARAWRATGEPRPPGGKLPRTAATEHVALLPYDDWQRCLFKAPPSRGRVPVVWHPWLDAIHFSPRAKCEVWAIVVDELQDKGRSTLLDIFYADSGPRASSTLTPQALAKISLAAPLA